MSKLIEAMIAEALNEPLVDLTDEVIEVQTSVEAINDHWRRIQAEQASKRSKYIPAAIGARTSLLIARCTNNQCSVHIALNPSKVQLAGLAITCKVCNSPMKFNKE